MKKNPSGKRDLNPQPQPWQGYTLPLSYFRYKTAQSQWVGQMYFLSRRRMDRPMLGKIRTLNPQIRSLVLYPIELQA